MRHAGRVRLFVCLLAILLCGASPTARWASIARAQESTPQQPGQLVFRGETTFVSVDVYPRVDGEVIEGLRAEDFQVLEDGVPQAVERFEFVRIEPNPLDSERRDPSSQADGDRQAADPRARVFVVYLDLTHTTIAGGHATRQPVVDFLKRTIGARDLFGVMTAEIPAAQLVFGRRIESIEDQLERHWTWGRAERVEALVTPRSTYETRLLDCVDNVPTLAIASLPYQGDATQKFQALTRLLLALHREDQLMSSLDNLMARLGSLRDERKNVLFISEGWVPRGPRDELAKLNASQGGLPVIGTGPSGGLGLAQTAPGRTTDLTWCDAEFSRLGSIDFERRFRLLLESANRANVAFYPVDVGGLRTAPGGAINTMRTLAESTDGFAVVSTNDLDGSVRRIERDLSAFYLLGYYSTNPAANGRFRRIDVRVNRPGVRVSARRGYLAPTAEMAAAAAAPRTVAAPSAVDEAVGRLLSIRADADLFASGAATADGLLVAVELSAAMASSTAWRSGAEVEAVATGADGANVSASATMAAGARNVVVTVPVGETSRGPWQVMVRAAGRDARLEQRIEIAAPAVRWIGAAVAWRGAPSPRAPLRPLVDGRMTRVERLRVEWPVQAEADTHVARLLDRTGKPLGQPLPFTPLPAERRALAVDLPMAALPEGDYVIELVATRGDESERRLLAFRVMR